MLGVDLGEAEHFGVGQRTSEVLLYLLQIVHFLLGEGQTFLLVVGFEVFDVDDGFRLAVGGEHLLVESLVHALEHGVVFGVFIGHGEVFLDARDARQAHVLGNFHGVRAPGRDHFAAGAYETAFQVFFTFRGGFSKKPAELVAVCLRDGVFACYGNHAFLRSSVERNHIFYSAINDDNNRCRRGPGGECVSSGFSCCKDSIIGGKYKAKTILLLCTSLGLHYLLIRQAAPRR